MADAAVLVFTPARLIAEVREAPLPLRRQAAAAAALAVLGAALVLLLPLPDVPERCALAVASLCAVAVAYVDVRWLVIPDLYSLMLAALALVGALRQPALTAVGGALLAGGLVWGVRLLWRRLRGVEGLGLGDVKLAAALGLLLGPEDALRTICLASILGVAAGLVMRHRRPSDSAQEEELIPFGAPLALCGLGVLYWSRLR